MRNDPREDLMEAVLERQAGSGDMCLSCHDGSVVDSRFKVWSTRHHTTDSVPSAAVNIPTDKFPLDAQGRMTCATCHTAHAVSDSSDIKTVIFLRQPNVDSALCLSCHPEHAQKNDFQHPLGRGDSPVPQVILEAGGKTSADGHAVICQTCHEPHGARNAWMLVLPPSKLCIACHTDKAPETKPAAGAPVHSIGHTYPGFEPPAALLDERATFGSNGELDCLSCHRLHDASGAKPLLIRKNEDSSLCLECHKKEGAVIESRHDLRLSSPETVNAGGEKPLVSGPCGSCHRIHGWARDVPETNRPHSSGCMECHNVGGPGSHNQPYVDAHGVGTTLSQGMSTTLPLDSDTGSIGCLTCHDPHSPRSSEITTEEGIPFQEAGSQVPEPRSFLRHEGSQLCALCHDKTGRSEFAPHEPMEFAPAAHRELAMHPSIGPCRVCHTTHNAQGPHLWARTPATGSGNPVSDLCGACHEDKLGVQNSVHDPGAAEWANKLGFVSRGSCVDCHPVHGSSKQDSIWATLGDQEAPVQLCEACHHMGGPGKVMETSHVGRIVGNDIENLPENLVVGDNGRILCTTCHDIHQKVQGPKLLRVPRRDSGLCLGCHSEFSGLLDTPHDLRISAPDEQNIRDEIAAESGPCGSCHLVHRTSRESGVWARGSTSEGDFGSALCTCCHRQGQCAEAHVPKYVDHPDVALLNRINSQQPGHMPTFDNRGEQSHTGSISCLTCHDPHAASLTPEARTKTSTSHRHMFLRPAEHQGLCVDCHGMETLWRFLYYHKEHRNPYPERNVNPPSPRKE